MRTNFDINGSDGVASVESYAFSFALFSPSFAINGLCTAVTVFALCLQCLGTDVIRSQRCAHRLLCSADVYICLVALTNLYQADLKICTTNCVTA